MAKSTSTPTLSRVGGLTLARPFWLVAALRLQWSSLIRHRMDQSCPACCVSPACHSACPFGCPQWRSLLIRPMQQIMDAETAAVATRYSTSSCPAWSACSVSHLPVISAACSGGGAGPVQGADHDAEQRLPVLHRAGRSRRHAGPAGEARSSVLLFCPPYWLLLRPFALTVAQTWAAGGSPLHTDGAPQYCGHRPRLLPPPLPLQHNSAISLSAQCGLALMRATPRLPCPAADPACLPACMPLPLPLQYQRRDHVCRRTAALLALPGC